MLNNVFKYIPLTIYKTDSITGQGLSGSVFELTDKNGSKSHVTTNELGLAVFCVIPCEAYNLEEINPPLGYIAASRVINVFVDAEGRVFSGGVNTSRIVVPNTAVLASFTAVLVNAADNMPLCGAQFDLLSNSLPIRSEVSNELGEVAFTNLLPGAYELVETDPPTGFQSCPNAVPVDVTTGGCATIFGIPADGYRLLSVPITPLVTTAADVSDPGGIVDFGCVAPGEYDLVETDPPPDNLPSCNDNLAAVGKQDTITVDEMPLDEFDVGNCYDTNTEMDLSTDLPQN